MPTVSFVSGAVNGSLADANALAMLIRDKIESQLYRDRVMTKGAQ